MATKTFNIGEYAVGGRIKVTIQGDVLTIDALSWNTKQLVSGQTFQKKTDWDGKTHFEGRPIDNFLNDLTSSYYAGKIMDWIKEKTEVKFAQGGNIDKEIKAKPRGWRFSGENNYKRPNASERGNKGTYYEDRVNRSDKDLRKRFEEGGEITSKQIDELHGLWGQGDYKKDEAQSAYEIGEKFVPELTRKQSDKLFFAFIGESSEKNGKTEKELIGNWEQTFIAHKKYPTTITEKVEELESKDEDLESDIQDKADEHELNEVKSVAEAAESNIDDIKSDISDLESRIEDMEDNRKEFGKGGILGELNKKYSFTDLFR